MVMRLVLMLMLLSSCAFGQGSFWRMYAAATAGSDSAFPTDGLVAYYPLDGNATDSVTGLTGTWGADVTETTNAISGTAASLNKAANSFITTAGGTNLFNGAPAFSVSMWINQRSSWVYYCGLFISYGGRPGTGFGFQGGSGSVPRGLRFNESDFPAFSTVGYLWAFEEWTHIGMSVSVGEPARFYVNGVLVDTSIGNLGSTISQYGDMLIGKDAAASGRNFGGWVDEVAAWNRIVTSNEFFTIATQRLTYEP